MSIQDYYLGYSKGFEAGKKEMLKELNSPKPVIIEKWNPSECPNCRCSFDKYEPCNDGYYQRATNIDRCPYCGQKLSWERYYE